MGASASKASQAGATTARRFPTRIPTQSAARPAQQIPLQQPATEGGQRAAYPVHDIESGASSDGSTQRDITSSSAFQDALRSIGPVDPRPTFSPSVSQFVNPRNTTSGIMLNARRETAERAEKEELGETGAGREFLDPWTLRQVLILRDRENRSAEDIEKELKLKPGVVARVGPKGLVELA